MPKYMFSLIGNFSAWEQNLRFCPYIGTQVRENSYSAILYVEKISTGSHFIWPTESLLLIKWINLPFYEKLFYLQEFWSIFLKLFVTTNNEYQPFYHTINPLMYKVSELPDKL